MTTSEPEDDLVLRLCDAAEKSQTGVPADAVMTGMLAEFETLIDQVRQPVAIDPCFSESELPLALRRAVAIGNGSPTEVFGGGSVNAISATPVVKTMLGQYELLDQIGSGGMGTVFRARHLRLGRIVALKMLTPGRLQSREAIARFEREMRAAGNLQHPNIVSAQDAGEVDGAHFLAMELVDGCDLSTLIKNHGPLRIADACEIVRQAAAGLQHFSDHGLIHRDIKPSNLMLARPATSDGTPLVKILDLGLAQFASGESDAPQDITATGQVIGTVDYMAPEQGLAGVSRLDIRADLYSLGATLFKLISGRAPFEESQYNTTLKRLQALEEVVPPSLSDLVPECPAELSAQVARLLSKSPEGRPPSPQELVRVLTPFVRGADLNALLLQHASATPPSISQTLTGTFQPDITEYRRFSAEAPLPSKRFTTRKWLTAAVASAICGLLVAAIVVLTDRGEIIIETPDDLAQDISVNVFRNGADYGTWKVRRAERQHSISSGRVEVRLPAEVSDEFDIQPTGELIVSRGNRTVLRVTRRAAVAKATHPNGEPQPVNIANREKAPPIHQPPPLEVWLKDRQLLTVAQDGTGQFQTIQAALTALKPGQAVKVLDRGPYRERLDLESPPEDSGLVSEQQTIIELTSWKKSEQAGVEGHLLSFAHGFRINGFAFAIAEDLEAAPFSYGLNIKQSAGVVFENCFVQWPGRSETFLGVNWFTEGPEQTCSIRDCLFANGLILNSLNSHARVMVERCFFTGTESGLDVSISDGKYDQITIRENVFGRSKHGQDVLLNFAHPGGHIHELQITNNTTLASTPLTISSKVPTGHIQIANNLRLNPGLLRFVNITENNAEAERQRAIREWDVGHNAYPRALRSGEQNLAEGNLFPTAKTDLLAPVAFLSTDINHRDFLRIAEGSRQSHSGRDGAWPKFIGALPPGSAPPNGDWFTTIRDRWQKTFSDQSIPTAPIAIVEPPPLNEWLQNRTVLSVAQDGSGQFKTISEAFRVLKPGQVVRVLDRGPYREALRFAVPADTGLISDVQSVIELPEWSPQEGAYHLSYPDGFRLNGLRIQVPPLDNWFTILSVTRPSGLVVENCSFGLTAAPMKMGPSAALQFFFDAKEREKQPVWIRECLFEHGGLNLSAGELANGTIVIEHNLFLQTGIAVTHADLQTLIVRHNVFDTPTSNPFWIDDLKHVRELLSITNNTMSRSTVKQNTGISFVTAAPPTNVVIRNNLSDSHAGLGPGAADIRTSALKNWVMDHNGYIRGWGTFAHSASDIVGPYEFLSPSSADANAWRLPVESPLATGGAGSDLPTYVGALPPGPAPQEGDWLTRLRSRWLLGNKPQ